MNATLVHRERVAPTIGSLSGFSDLDYSDAFRVTTAGVRPRSPARWAHALVEDAAGVGGQVLWRGMLGLRLDARAPARIGGWTVAERADSWIRLEATSRILRAHIVVLVDGPSMIAGTFLKYDHPLAQIIWRPLSAVHRRAMPKLLRRAAKRVSEE